MMINWTILQTKEVLKVAQDDARVKFEGENWKRFLKQVKNRIDVKKMNPIASTMAYADIVKHFEEERGTLGRWKRWSPSYFKQMQRRGKAGNKVLQDTGHLRQSIVPSGNRIEAKNTKFTKDSILWINRAKTRTGFPYAYAHDTGGPKLPQRQFMWLSKSALDKIAKGYLKFIAGG